MFLFSELVKPSSHNTSNGKLPKMYEEYTDVFYKYKASKRLEHCPYDCSTNLEEVKEPP